MKTYSTLAVAQMVGVHRVTLQHWVSQGKINASVILPWKDRNLRRWTDRDVARLLAYKQKNYRKGRGIQPRF